MSFARLRLAARFACARCAEADARVGLLGGLAPARLLLASLAQAAHGVVDGEEPRDGEAAAVKIDPPHLRVEPAVVEEPRGEEPEQDRQEERVVEGGRRRTVLFVAIGFARLLGHRGTIAEAVERGPLP